MDDKNLIEEYYADAENCYKDIRLAREVFGSMGSTVDEWDAAERGLGFMFIYCPDDISDLVIATLNELQQRKLFLKLYGKMGLGIA